MSRTGRGASAPEVVWFDHARGGEPQEGFGRGEAGEVRLSPDGFLESDTRVRFGGNGYHALVGHGVVDALGRLAMEGGPLDDGRDVILRPAALEDAAAILYEADRKTYGRRWEFVVGVAAGREYRIAIDNRDYQRTLARLQFLATSAARMGNAVRLRFDPARLRSSAGFA